MHFNDMRGRGTAYDSFLKKMVTGELDVNHRYMLEPVITNFLADYAPDPKRHTFKDIKPFLPDVERISCVPVQIEKPSYYYDNGNHGHYYSFRDRVTVVFDYARSETVTGAIIYNDSLPDKELCIHLSLDIPKTVNSENELTFSFLFQR